MKRTKVFRIMAMILALSITMSLAGCGSSTAPTKTDETTPSVSQEPSVTPGDDATSTEDTTQPSSETQPEETTTPTEETTEPSQPPVETPTEEEELNVDKEDRYFTAFAQSGDVWNLGEHRLVVGDVDPMVDNLISQYVYQTGNVGISCVRGETEYGYIELLKEWAEENDVMDEVFSAKKPVILTK